MADDKVTPLPVKFKKQGDDEPMLKIVHGGGKCDHRWVWRDGKMHSVTYLICDGDAEVECSACGTRLDPMFVLRRLAGEETKWHEMSRRYQEEMKRLDERSRTQCDYCGRMTRISRRK